MPRVARKDLVLAGDVGGTNARFRLYDLEGKRVVHEQTFPSRTATSLAALLGPYVDEAPGRVRAAVLGIAGPVVDGVSRTTNLPWVVDERKLARASGVPVVSLVNDLAAVAIGCTRVRPAARTLVAAGKPPKTGNAAVISAGTGLGEALLVWEGGRYTPVATEGGHADFAPRNELETELFRYLQRVHGDDHVSYERVLSGPGIGNLYDFFCERDGVVELQAVQRQLEQGDRNATVTKLGLSRKSVAAAQAIEAFAGVYGAEAGNLALKGLATRGVYVCGRIAGEILPKRKALFLAAMRDKGRLRALLERTPVHIVQDELVGLIGAGYLAARLAAAT